MDRGRAGPADLPAVAELATLQIRWARRLLALEDRDGRSLTVDLDDLRADPTVCAAFLAAVRRSRAGGLVLDRGTEAALGLG